MDLILDNWRMHWPGAGTHVLLTLVAVACGAILGSERERHEKPAGLRTMMLVSLGSATFTMVGFSFTSSTGDSGRIAAQIVTGIGFLGAGVVLRGTGGVQGVTTAATIWVVAAIGMTIGAGYAAGGFGLALLTRGVLTVVGRWEQSFYGDGRASIVTLAFNPEHGKTAIKLERLLAEFSIPPDAVQRADAGNGLQQWSIQFRLPELHHHEFLAELAEMPQVVSVDAK